MTNERIQEFFLSAAQTNSIDPLKCYLSTVINPNDYLNQLYDESMQQKWTILMIACLKEDTDMMEMLLENFQPDLEVLNIVRIRDKDQQFEIFENVTVLWVAAALNNFHLVQLLVEHGANVNHRIKTNSTPVRCACCNDNIEMVRYLVQHGADIHITKIKNFTNLVASVFNGHLPMVMYLVDELGCDVNECLDDGRSPLSAAVYNGSFEIVQFLLERGARNFSADYNQMTPLMLAAEKRRIDLVNAISPYCSLVEHIEAEELLASAFICLELGQSDTEQAIGHLTRALELRFIHQLPKVINRSTHAVFNHRHECQTVDQLSELQLNSNYIYIEALLIRERLLGPRNIKYRHSLRYRGALLADQGEFNAGLALWMYELAFYQSESIDIDKENIRQFVSLLSSMMEVSIPIPIDNLCILMTVMMEELKKTYTGFDYNLSTLLFFITISSQVLLETVIAQSDRKRLYQAISTIVQCKFVTRTFDSSLLHLCVDQRTKSYDYNFDRIYSYPSLITILVLLQCGADINANDFKRCTPLHIFVSNTTDCHEKILKLLCQAGAHVDYKNRSGETPLDLVENSNMKRLLVTNMKINLKCLCARLIQKEKFSYHGMISPALASFVAKH